MAHPKWLIAISFNLHTLQLDEELNTQPMKSAKWFQYFRNQHLSDFEAISLRSAVR